MHFELYKEQQLQLHHNHEKKLFSTVLLLYAQKKIALLVISNLT
jgi:hypothetical protein